MLKRKKILVALLSVVVIVSVAFSCPALTFGATSDLIITYPVDKPAVGTYSGYVVVLYETSSGGIGSRLITYSVTPMYADNTNDSLELYPNELVNVTIYPSSVQLSLVGMSNTSCYVSGQAIYPSGSFYTFSSSGQTEGGSFFSWNTDSYEFIGFQVYGGCVRVTHTLDNLTEFSVLFSTDSLQYQALLDVSDLLMLIYSQDTEKYAEQIKELQSISSSSLSIDQKLTSVVNILQSINTNIDSFNSDFNGFVLLYEEKMSQALASLDAINIKLNDIDNKLQDILDILNSQGSNEEWTNVDDSSINDYESTEDNLTQDKTQDVEDNVKVEMDTHANGVIWNIIEQVVKTNNYVYGFYMSILALAIVALILNR